MNATKIEKNNNGLIPIKPKKSAGRSRVVTAFFMLAILIPYIVLASTSSFVSEGYNLFFVSVLFLLVGYCSFEATYASLRTEMKLNDSKFYMILLSQVGFIIIFGWFAFQYTMHNPVPLYAGLLALLTNFILFLVVTSFIDVSFKKIAAIGIINLLMTVFLTVIMITAFNLYWNILFWPIFIVVMTDVFAYYGGKAFGTEHPFPNISPNKTTEGLTTGIIMGFIGGVVWYFALIYPTGLTYEMFSYNNVSGTTIGIPISYGFLFSIIPAVITPLGDLFFSKIKRELDVKDFNNLLPGHGGVLDRVDSHSFAITISMILLITLLYSSYIF